jgi:HTH-type transcriptional regulator/antitoxin HigA
MEKIFQAKEGTAQAKERDVWVTRVEAYEIRKHDFGPADPVEAIQFRMEQEGLTPRDLELCNSFSFIKRTWSGFMMRGGHRP